MLGNGMHDSNAAYWSSYFAGPPMMINTVPQFVYSPMQWVDAATGSPLVQWDKATTGTPVIHCTGASSGHRPDAAMVAGPPLIRRHVKGTPKNRQNSSSLNRMHYVAANVNERSVVLPNSATSTQTVESKVSSATGAPLIQYPTTGPPLAQHAPVQSSQQDGHATTTDRTSLQVAVTACGSSVQIASMVTDGSSLSATAVSSDGSVMRAASFVSDGSSMRAMSVVSNGVALHATSMRSDKSSLHAAAISSDQSSLHATSVSCDQSSMQTSTINANTSSGYLVARKSSVISTYNGN